MLHISEISEQRIRDVRDELKLGDQVLVKVLAIEGNKIRLSRKALLREAREKQRRETEDGCRAGQPCPRRRRRSNRPGIWFLFVKEARRFRAFFISGLGAVERVRRSV